MRLSAANTLPILLAAILSASATPVDAQGTALAYQGRLVHAGAPADGKFDMRFTVYDAPTGGVLVAGPIERASTPVSGGQYEVTLDFGVGVYPGPARWVEIEVRSGAAYYSRLPRQPLDASSVIDRAIGGWPRAAITTDEGWQQRTNPGLAPRNHHSAVWTGSEMIVWGGRNGQASFLNDGARYNPVANSWTALPATGAPAARGYHTAVWTGSEMIVWGGQNEATCFDDGARYNPAANRWLPVSTSGAPVARCEHTAVWTGTEMIVWGGTNSRAAYLGDGARYNPATDRWTAMSMLGAPAARSVHAAVWTGIQMIVWGGIAGNFANPFNDGGRYMPSDDSWAPVTTTGAPPGRSYHSMIWTGNEMIVWGGNIGGANSLGNGGRYDPAANTWTAVNNNGALSARYQQTAVWTGSEVVIWGGLDTRGILDDGSRYSPAGDKWTAMSSNGAPSARFTHSAIWTGSEMLLWAGFNAGYFGDLYSYDPGRSMSLYQRR